MTEEKNDTPWPSEPKYFQWKGTVSKTGDTSNVLAHCKPRKQDVFIKIKETSDDEDSDIDEILKFSEYTKKLINIHHENLLTPVHSFVFKTEIWVIYERHSGGALIELLSSHYPNGIPDESIVSSILYDIACGLHNLHKHQQCHRNIRASSIHIDIDKGRALLSEFTYVKDIKYKNQNKTNKRNTMITPEREPFTDPLILYNEGNGSWYAGDIYAFGITALQLTYGTTPPLKPKDILNQESLIIDTYDRKCPFSKSFELLIKQTTTRNIDKRISIVKLLEHKFFKLKCEPITVKQTFGHILKSTEKRINSSLPAPISFTTSSNTHLNGLTNNNENKNGQNQTATNKSLSSSPPSHKTNTEQNKITNGMKTIIEQTNNNPIPSMPDQPLTPSWSFSTSINKNELNKLNENNQPQPTIHEDVVQGPDLHKNASPTFHDPSNQHKNNHPSPSHSISISDNNNNNKNDILDAKNINKNNKNDETNHKRWHVSYSASESQKDSILADVNNNNNNDNTHGRFKVEYPSRLSESTGTQPEPSETFDESEHPLHHNESDEEHDPDLNDGNQLLTNNPPPTNAKQTGRFVVVPASNDPQLSADEDDTNHNNNNNNNLNNAQINNNTPNQSNKTGMDNKECANWVGSLGKVYKQYIEVFENNGIDGPFMSEITDEILKEIVKSALHRKKIIFAWGKL